MIKEKIEFCKTSNVFLNSGIIGLYIYLNKCKEEINFDYQFKLEENKLTIESDNLMGLLELVYYEMGKEYYDTSGKNALDEVDKYYFIKEPFEGKPFAKMNTYGFASLITNNPTATASKDGEKIKFEKLYKNNLEFANNIANYLKNKGKKLKYFYFDKNNELKENEINIKTGKRSENNGGESEVFIDAGYTKTPELSFDNKYLQAGDKYCPLTGENFIKLLNYKSTSPFIAGLNVFDSFGSSNTRQISWKAVFLNRFSPVLAFYKYIDKIRSKIVCYFFQSDNLVNIYRLYKKYNSLFMHNFELIENDYMSNFKIFTFDSQKKDFEVFDKNTDYVWQNEILFILLYSFYKNFLFIHDKKSENKNLENDFKPPKRCDELPVSLIYFRSDSFASTMRPQLFEEFNNYKFIVSLFKYFEENEEIKLDSKKMYNFLKSLKFKKESEKSSLNNYSLERKLRNQILKNILLIKSILDDIKILFYNSFCDSFNDLKSESKIYRDYNLVFNITKYYEKIILFGGNENMNEDLQEKAIKLGTSIGKGIINYDSPKNELEKKANVKGGRKYIISLNKSRTLQQFLNEIIRIQTKFGMVVSEELLKGINENNWEYIRNFCIIKTLSLLNSELQLKKQENK